MVLSAKDRLHLEQSRLFSGIAVESIVHLLEQCALQSVTEGAILLEAGAQNRDLYVVLEGELRVYLADSSMPAHAILGPGECAGELSLLDGSTVSAQVLAAKPSRLLVIGHDILWALVDRSHGIARNLLGVLSGRIRSNNLTLVAAQSKSLEFEQAGSVDVLTGLHNKIWLMDAYARTLQRADRDHAPACLMLADIDYFKAFNDRFGNLAGDHMLRAVATQLADGLRAQDLIARYGGDEFLILLSRTELDEGMLIAERLRGLVADGSDTDKTDGVQDVTLSAGIAAHIGGESLEQLIARASVALRLAKDGGRDRVEVTN